MFPIVLSRLTMTYCLGILTHHGLVMAADSRTNAGIDYVSSHQKLHNLSIDGDRVLLLCSSGNLSVTQSVMTLIYRDIKANAAGNLHQLATLYDVSRYLGEKMREVQALDRPWLQKDGIDSSCCILLGGQIGNEDPGLYLIYSQGNSIQASHQTPFLQIGETKYGKPILDRVLTFDTPIKDAAKCALLSLDSTMKSNVSVGPPIDLIMYQRDSLTTQNHLRFNLGSPYLVTLRRSWEESLKEAFDRIPEINWTTSGNEPPIDEIIGK
jgi:putative proteasome-type protease